MISPISIDVSSRASVRLLDYSPRYSKRALQSDYQMRIETDASGYAIGAVLSQLTDLGRWHPVAYYSRKMIPAETRYKTYNAELLAIVKPFKTRQHYLKGCKHEVLVLTDHNNLCHFMKMKSLSCRQVR